MSRAEIRAVRAGLSAMSRRRADRGAVQPNFTVAECSLMHVPDVYLGVNVAQCLTPTSFIPVTLNKLPEK